MKWLKFIIIAIVLFGGFLALNHFQNSNGKTAYISITFDDAYASQYQKSGLLESYGWRGTFYVPAGIVSGQIAGRQLMNWYQVKALQDKGHEIGCHTLNHIGATNISEINYDAEVFGCKQALLERGITPVENFAYPYGDDTYKEAGKFFVTARTVKACVNKFSDKELCGLTLVHMNGEFKILQSYLSELNTNDGWLVLVIHDINDNTRADADLTTDDFAWILEQIKNSRIKVKTVAEVVNEKA